MQLHDSIIPNSFLKVPESKYTDLFRYCLQTGCRQFSVGRESEIFSSTIQTGRNCNIAGTQRWLFRGLDLRSTYLLLLDCRQVIVCEKLSVLFHLFYNVIRFVSRNRAALFAAHPGRSWPGRS